MQSLTCFAADDDGQISSAEMESAEMVKALYLHMVDAQQRAENAANILNWMHWNTVANSLRRKIQEQLAAEGAQAEKMVWS